MCLLSFSALCLTSQQKKKDTLLVMAVRLGNGGVTNQLILAGANIEAKNKVILRNVILVYVVILTFQSTLCLLGRLL